jgi:flavorubredoxin
MSTSSTNIHEIANGIYRINTPVDIPGGGFSFNQYLVLDDAPLLFHTGPRKLFPVVSEALATLMPLARLRYIAFSHFEADECGALNDWLAQAPDSVPVCGRIAAMVSVNDVADRPAHAMGDGEVLELGSHSMKWLDASHLPHGWENGYMFDTKSGTMMCGDLFTQPGHGAAPVTTGDILGPSEAFRQHLDYFSHSTNTAQLIEKLARENPSTLACMHGSAWQGDGASLLRSLGASLIQ